MNLKNTSLLPVMKTTFIKYSNANLDDIANAVSSIDIDLKVNKDLEVTTDLDITETVQKKMISFINFQGKTGLFSLL
jgi:hypothetical protein